MAAFSVFTPVTLMLMLALACSGARADTQIGLLKSFAGNVNFVGTQQTLRNKGNKKPCEVFDAGSERSATLPAIPENSTILSAHLYWAGSGKTADYSVIFDDVTIAADSDRKYTSGTIGNGFNYFSGAADVTAQVKKNFADKKKKHKYSFRGLSVNTGSPYCAVEGVLGGFALLVIYSDPNESFRVLNLYEGFQFMRYSGITLNFSGFRVPNPIGNATGRVGHITWEGDQTLDGGGENLKFNGYAMTDGQNPTGNQFNSASNIDGDGKSYGIDFDAYTIRDPVIKGGQTTASTRYESGQDLVLLSAEIIAMPNVPMSDLSLSLQLTNEMTLGQNARYSLVVTNKGPSTETGPTVVTTTLPAGLTYVSMTGTDWTCTRSGQLITCTYSLSLLAGNSLPALNLLAQVAGTGKHSVSATVSGAMYDPALGNNTVIVEGIVADGAAKYVFTDKACEAGVAVDTTDKCSTTLRPNIAGETRTIYITQVADGMPITPAKSTESMQFALSCINPEQNAGISAVYAGSTLPYCADKGAEPTSWSAAATLAFSGVSAPADFRYADVGQVRLFLRPVATSKVSGSVPFVSVPHEVRISNILGTDGSAAPLNPQDNSTYTIRAGLAFTATAGAYAQGGTLTPNFGKESAGVSEPATFTLPAVGIGASTADGIAAMTHAAVDPHEAHGYELPKLRGEFKSPQEGKSTAQFMWDDVGIIKLIPGITSSTYLGVSLSGMVVTPGYAGRFIPHHFKTDTTQRMGCTPKMSCDPSGVDSVAYSREKFDVTVTARSANGQQTMNYRGTFAREVVLSAWDKAGGTAQKTDLSEASAKAVDFDDGAATVLPFYTLINPFSHLTPKGPWGAPDIIFLRAVETGGAVKSNVDVPLEAGIWIVNGRLLVPSAHGSERLNLPLQLSAQYWSGSNWELSSNDKHNVIDPDPGKVSFSNFNGLPSGSLSLLPSTMQLLNAGVAKFSVKTPGMPGSADLQLNQMIWLPSTVGRLRFGTHKSPLIYLRELH